MSPPLSLVRPTYKLLDTNNSAHARYGHALQDAPLQHTGRPEFACQMVVTRSLSFCRAKRGESSSGWSDGCITIQSCSKLYEGTNLMECEMALSPGPNA